MISIMLHKRKIKVAPCVNVDYQPLEEYESIQYEFPFEYILDLFEDKESIGREIRLYYFTVLLMDWNMALELI